MSHSRRLGKRVRGPLRRIYDGFGLPDRRIARRLMKAGPNGLFVRSYAPGSTAEDLNLVLWTWGDWPPAHLVLIDDEARLSR